MTTIDLSGARLSLENMAGMLKSLTADRIEMHPYQLQWYEESAPPSSFALISDKLVTVGGIPVSESLLFPLDEVRFYASDKLTGRIVNLARPVLYPTAAAAS